MNHVPTKQQLKELMQVIEDDITSDVKELDGKPLDAKIVAQTFGKMGAAIVALTSALQYIIDHTYKDEHVAVQETPTNDGRTKSSHL